MNHSAIMNMVFSGGSALAGLVLVFLGSQVAAFEQFGVEQRKYVRAKFKSRVYVSFGGFVCSLASAALALAHELGFGATFSWSLLLLGLSSAFLAWTAIITLFDLGA